MPLSKSTTLIRSCELNPSHEPITSCELISYGVDICEPSSYSYYLA